MTWVEILKPILEKCKEENIGMMIDCCRHPYPGENDLLVKFYKERLGCVKIIQLSDNGDNSFYEPEIMVNTILDDALEKLNKEEDEFRAKESDEIHQTILMNIKKED